MRSLVKIKFYKNFKLMHTIPKLLPKDDLIIELDSFDKCSFCSFVTPVLNLQRNAFQWNAFKCHVIYFFTYYETFVCSRFEFNHGTWKFKTGWKYSLYSGVLKEKLLTRSTHKKRTFKQIEHWTEWEQATLWRTPANITNALSEDLRYLRK